MNRRDLLKLSSYAAAAASAPPLAAAAAPVSGGSIARWDVMELSFDGPATGNPFVDVALTATFTLKNRSMTVEGFYDGEGTHRIRFMPDELGKWTWTTISNHPGLNGRSGAFLCVAPDAENHGPISVRDGFHFAYADGTPYVECGTTCYAWAFQGDDTQRRTIETLSSSPFNKLRMCVFPKSYDFNTNEPERYPFPLLVRGASVWDGGYMAQ